MLISRVLSIIFACIQIVTPFISNFLSGTERYRPDWSPDMEYRLEDTFIIEKDPDKDFVILNLTDTQLDGDEAFSKQGRLLKNTVKELVEQTQPDLITVTGDIAWGYMAYIQLINLIDSFGIPWAPVLGNHDNSDSDPEWESLRFLRAKNCLYSFGPEGMGYGNYIINITENGKVVESVIMMDTHSNNDFTLPDGSVIKGYDCVWDNQMEWYKWAVNGVQPLGNGGTVKSVVMMHIPIYEYNTAYALAWNNETQTWNDGYDAFGIMLEPCCSPPVSTGFFDLVKRLGSTTDILCGHDHVNNWSILYEGVRLTYSLKTGSGGYWTEDGSLSGGTTVTLDSTGNSTVEHIYIEPNYDLSIFEPSLWSYPNIF